MALVSIFRLPCRAKSSADLKMHTEESKWKWLLACIFEIGWQTNMLFFLMLLLFCFVKKRMFPLFWFYFLWSGIPVRRPLISFLQRTLSAQGDLLWDLCCKAIPILLKFLKEKRIPQCDWQANIVTDQCTLSIICKSQYCEGNTLILTSKQDAGLNNFRFILK